MNHNTPLPFQGWIASLSDGETVYEQPPLPNEKTSWQKLLDRLAEYGLTITMLRVQRNGVTLHALPPKACGGYYQAYEVRQKVYGGKVVHLQACGSVIEDKVLIIWIDENGNLYQDLRPLAEEKMHTTLRDQP